jgi:hypothetical protein
MRVIATTSKAAATTMSRDSECTFQAGAVNRPWTPRATSKTSRDVRANRAEAAAPLSERGPVLEESVAVITWAFINCGPS